MHSGIFFVKNTILSLNPPLKGSTNLLEGLKVSSNILSGDKNFIIVFSDGGDEDISKIVSFIRFMNIATIFYGIGTEKGGKVPGYNAVSRLNMRFSGINRYENAYFIKYLQNDKDINQISMFIKKYINDKESMKIKIPDYLYLSPFLALISLFLIFLRFLSKRFFFILFFFSLSLPSYSGELKGYFYFFMKDYRKAGIEFLKEKNPENLYNGAVSFLKAGEYEKALNILKEINTEDIHLQKRIKYNIAFIYLLKKEYKKGKSELEKIYLLFPEDKKIKKLYLYLSFLDEIYGKTKKETIVKIKEKKSRSNPQGQKEQETVNPW